MEGDADQERKSSRARPARWSLRGLAATLLVGLLALLAYGLTTSSPNATIDEAISRGRPDKAPPFRLDLLQAGALGSALAPNLTGAFQRRSIALSELRGTPVVLNFWASWCVPCKEEAPTLELTWRQRAQPSGVLFLGLNTQDTPSEARTFMRQYAIDYPNVSDPGEGVLRSYGAPTLPQTFFIDRRGRVVGHLLGRGSAQALAAGMTRAAGGRVAGSAQGELRATDVEVTSLLAGIQQRGNTLGDPKAPVTVQYFGDLQCPACRLFTLSVLPSLIERYVRSGKLKIEYRSLQTVTRKAGVFKDQQMAALAAGRQNKLWNFIELFYHEQGREHSGYVTERYLQGLAQQVPGLNLVEWTAARSDPYLVRTLMTDAQAASSARLNSTPEFLVVKRGPPRPYLAAIEQQLRGRPSSKAGQ
jgi:cytochrome c biogenesis protein CcmG/thiol:disulfide interchange protein DsbE